MINKIKKHSSITTLILSFLLISLTDIKAQKIELSPFFGYQTATQFPSDQNQSRIVGGINYGVSMNYAITRTWRLEISYNYLKSDISTYSMYGRYKYCNLNSKYLSLGGLKEIKPGNKVNPFGILIIGWVNHHPTSDGYYDANLVHFSLGGGVKVAVTDNFGFRFQASLIMPVWSAGEYFGAKYYGPLLIFTHATVVAEGDFTIAAILVLDKRHEL
jgi:hypothetical protein